MHHVLLLLHDMLHVVHVLHVHDKRVGGRDSRRRGGRCCGNSCSSRRSRGRQATIGHDFSDSLITTAYDVVIGRYSSAFTCTSAN